MCLTAYAPGSILETLEVVATDEFVDWYDGLKEVDVLTVDKIVGLLEAAGVRLGMPYSSAIKGSRYAFRELRVQSQGRPLRIIYAFDPVRDAVLILGGEPKPSGSSI